MATSSGVLTICLDAYCVLVDPKFPAELKGDAQRLLRTRLPELSPKDADQYYKAIPAIRERYMHVGPAGDVVSPPGGVDVEVADTALPDPGLDWSF